MTRRGSLVYYMAAWILGCFFISFAVWLRAAVSATLSTRSAFELMLFYFYGLMLGASTCLLAAWLLRRLMKALKCKTPGHWAVAGAALMPALIVALGEWGRRMGLDGSNGHRILEILFLGPVVMLHEGWWLAIPAGAATAYFLGRIERAFAPQKANASA